jgi:hypothetical protein
MGFFCEPELALTVGLNIGPTQTVRAFKPLNCCQFIARLIRPAILGRTVTGVVPRFF